MRFDAPAALWFLAVLPAIVLLHMLRARRQDLPISSVLWWQRAREDVLAHRPVRRIERSALLVLQLLAAAFVALALAHPSVVRSAASGPRMVVVLDVSVRMQATDIVPSRFEAARAAALAEISKSPDTVMVVRAGVQPRAITGFVSPAVARAAVTSLSPTDAPASLEQAVTLALAQRAGGGRARVVVFSDHAVTAAPGVEYHVVGRSTRNVAVIGIRAEPTASGVEAIVQIRNAGPAPEHIPLTVTLGSERILARTVDVPAEATIAVPVPVRGEGILTARIDPHDPVSVDDVGYAVVGGPPMRALLLGERDRALETALQAAGAEVTASPARGEATLASADVVVLNRTVPVELPPGNYLLLASTARNLPLAVDGVVSSPHILRWSTSHPVMRYVDLREVAITRTLALHPSGGEVLAEGEVPLIWAYDGGGVRAIVVGFSLHDADLSVQPAFPILVRNALAWLTGTGLSYEAGQTLSVPARGQTEAVLRYPDGSRAVLAAQGGTFVVPVLERVGVYTLQVGDRAHQIAVNPATSAVDIAPVTPVRDQSSLTRNPASRRLIDLAPSLLAVALFLLLGEWALWLRRLPRRRSPVARPVLRP